MTGGNGTCAASSRPCGSATTRKPPRLGRASVVAPATPSPTALRKAATRRTPHGAPVHSFRTLLDDLATI